MSVIAKETLLKAEDSKNRDAILFDMLNSVEGKLDKILNLKEKIEKVEKQISYIKGVGATIAAIFSAVVTWIIKNV